MVKTVLSLANGEYSFDVKEPWSGTVTPSKSSYIFAPVSRTYTNVTTDQASQNYTATPLYSISGNVGIADVTLSYMYSTPKTVTSQSNGSYSLSVPSGWVGAVTPAHPCFTFSPVNRNYSNLGASQASQDYVPTLIPGSGCAEIDLLSEGESRTVCTSRRRAALE